MFSLSVFLENSFTNVFQELCLVVIHAYTERSLAYLSKKYNLKIIGEYWFGTDIPDLHRSLICSGKILNKKIYHQQLNEKLFKFVDDLQAVLDKNKVCSELHIIFEKK